MVTPRPAQDFQRTSGRSLASTGVTFVLGTIKIGKSILGLTYPTNPDKAYMARVLGGVVTGIDLYLIGIALLIFGYGVYELLISPIEAARESKGGGGLLDIRDLDQLKEKLVKVLVVALIVAAFKAMLTLPITDGPSLAFFCLSVLLLAISGVLVTGTIGHGSEQAGMAAVASRVGDDAERHN